MRSWPVPPRRTPGSPRREQPWPRPPPSPNATGTARRRLPARPPSPRQRPNCARRPRPPPPNGPTWRRSPPAGADERRAADLDARLALPLDLGPDETEAGSGSGGLEAEREEVAWESQALAAPPWPERGGSERSPDVRPARTTGGLLADRGPVGPVAGSPRRPTPG